MPKKVIAKAVVNRKKGKLYFIDAKGNVCETEMKKGGTKGHKTCKPCAKKAAKKKPVRKAAPKKKAAPKRKPVARKKAATKRKAAKR